MTDILDHPRRSEQDQTEVPAIETAPAAAANPPPVENTPTRSNARKRAFVLFGAILLLAALAWGMHALFFTSASEETDDAYVAGDVVAITAREPGVVLALHADNTETVKKGQTLIELDPATSDAAMATAEADLARSVRNVRSNFSKVDESQAEVVQARAELARARNDFARRRGAAADGAVSGEELSHAADTVSTAKAALTLAESRLAQSRSAVQGTNIETNPDVLSAIAAFRRAAIAKGHMRLLAPVDGVIAQRSVQLGQQVAPGTPLMAVVPLQRVWIDANFRETQLQHFRIGQPATVVADIYGGDVSYHGRVIGLGAGSGNAFALLPPQNASGNWIKISQRLPVRIALDPKELATNPLRIGLSAKVTVNVEDHSGPLIARAATGTFQQQASQDGGAEVEARIARIISANRGGAVR
jgi:membrane fusion protein (multidrug efflux system)